MTSAPTALPSRRRPHSPGQWVAAETRSKGPMAAWTALCPSCILHLPNPATNATARAWVEAEVLLCVLPCGRSAHVELGMALGLSIPVVLVHDGIEPDMMHLGVDAVVGLNPPGAGEFPSREFQDDLANALAMARDSQSRGRTWYGNFLEYTIGGSPETATP